MDDLAAAQLRPHPELIRIDILEAHARRQLVPVLEKRRQRERRVPIDVRAIRAPEHARLLPR